MLYCWEITTIRKYLKINKYLNLDPNTGIITTKSAVEKTKRSKLSFKHIWVIVSNFVFWNTNNNFFFYLTLIYINSLNKIKIYVPNSLNLKELKALFF